MQRGLALVALLVVVFAACGDDDGSEAPEASSIAAGRGLYQSTCAVCHGSGGEGGIGRALDSVATDFPECAEQVRWITLGSSRWEDEVGPTFGTSAVPVAGGMPEFEDTLTEAEIRAVSAFTRVRFGGQPEADALSDCGA